MKICDLTQFYSPVGGGVKRYLDQKVKFWLQAHDQNEHLLIIPGEHTQIKNEGRSRVYTIRSPLISKTSRYRILLALSEVSSILQSEAPHLIESADPYQLAWQALSCGRMLGIPTVGFYHSHFPEAYIRSIAKFFTPSAVTLAQRGARAYVRSLYNRFSCTLVPSPALAQLLQEWGVQRVHSVELGVDTDIFHIAQQGAEGAASARRAELGIDPTHFVLLYVGRLAAEKNVSTLFQAFELLSSPAESSSQSSSPFFHLVVVGDGQHRQDLLALQQKTQAVTWLPYCNQSHQLAIWYQMANLFVHPGILETFGLVTLEAQACGTPVVGIRGSYMDRIVFTNQSHWAAENTPEALARAIRHAAETQNASDGINASERVRRQYSWDFVFQRLFSIYDSLIKKYRGKRASFFSL